MVDFHISTEGAPIATEAQATDLIGEAVYSGAERIVFPVARLAPEFFKLATGLAGAVLQTCANYRLKVAIVGDISAYMARSAPLRDFVYECNTRGDVRFVGSDADL